MIISEPRSPPPSCQSVIKKKRCSKRVAVQVVLLCFEPGYDQIKNNFGWSLSNIQTVHRKPLATATALSLFLSFAIYIFFFLFHHSFLTLSEIIPAHQPRRSTERPQGSAKSTAVHKRTWLKIATPFCCSNVIADFYHEKSASLLLPLF